MRNWKKSLLLAAGFAVLIPSAAMATQKNSEQTDTVTVEVKNVKGGALGVYYQDPETKEEYWLPIGEKVKIPKDTELTIKTQNREYEDGEFERTNFSWNSEKYGECVSSHLKSLYINGKDGSENVIQGENISDSEGNIYWNADHDYTFTADFEAEMIISDRDLVKEFKNQNKLSQDTRSTKENYFIEYPQILNIDSSQIAEIKLNAKNGKNKVDVLEVPGLRFDYEASGSDHDKEFLEHTSGWFEFTSTGIKSKKNLPLGAYNIPYVYKRSSTSTEESPRTAHINVGKQVSVGTSLGIFENEEGIIEKIWEVGPRVLTNKYIEDPKILRSKYFFDGEKTTVGDIVRQLDVYSASDCKKYSGLSGYEMTNRYKDFKGKIIDVNSIGKLKNATESGNMFVSIDEIYEKNGTEFKPAIIKAIPDSELTIYYYDTVMEENGKYYYYDNNGDKVIGAWVYPSVGGMLFCGPDDGAIITNGIAGISMSDMDGLRYVGEDGRVDYDYSGFYDDGKQIYEVDKGYVESIIEKIDTPSNPEEITDRIEEMEDSMEEMSEGQFMYYADKIMDGLSSLPEDERANLSTDMIEKIDKVLKYAYDVENEKYVKFAFADDVDSATLLSADDINVTGILAAAGVKSDSVDNTKIELKITQELATASNAIPADTKKHVLRFKADLYVNEKKTQLGNPILIVITLPESVKKICADDTYTFVVEHITNDGKQETITPEFSGDFTTMTLRANSFSTFELLATKKDSGNSGDNKDDNGNTSGGNTSGGNTSGGNTSGGNTSGGNTSGGNTSGGSTSGGSSSGGSSSKKVKTYHAPAQKTEETIGKWQQDQNGWWFRFNNGSWPKNQWIELIWNGTSSWYYFNEKGYMETSWHKDGDEWYYLNPESDGTRGAMVTGWKQINNIWYYFSTVAGGPKGAMLSNTVTPDGYRIGADGAWVK